MNETKIVMLNKTMFYIIIECKFVKITNIFIFKRD